MGTILASAIIDSASEILQDETNVRWKRPKLLKWLYDGVRDLIILKPSAYVRNEAVKLAAGTKQELPVRGLALMDVTRNMGTNGTTPGRVPRFIEKKRLDDENPNWHRDTANALALHFTYDDRDPKHFYVYPAQPAANQGYVELVFSAEPIAFVETDAIPLDDIYASALIDYLLYRSYAKDPVNAELANSYFQSFGNRVAGKAVSEASHAPSPEREG